MASDKVQVSVYLTPELSKEDPDCRDATCQAISNALDANPEVQSKEFESQAQALEQKKSRGKTNGKTALKPASKERRGLRSQGKSR